MKKSLAGDSQPTVSVVVPAYNAAATIGRAIASALAQTVPPLEIVVVDDGSTDNTAAIAESFSDTRVRFLRLSSNRGPAAARNRGLDEACGAWIAYLDADDVWHPQKLERCLALLPAFPDAVLLYHGRSAEPLPELFPAVVPRRQNWRSLLLTNPVATPAAMHPALPGQRWNEAMRHMEDHDFFLRLAERGPVVFLPLPLVMLGRPLLSAGGLSGDVAAMRAGERSVLREAARRRPFVRLLLPALLLLSRLKALLRPWRRVR